jgi:hypothetical protein
MVCNFNGVKVFTATKAVDRDQLGEKLTEWVKANPKLLPVATRVVQSSDNKFHCLSLVLFFQES